MKKFFLIALCVVLLCVNSTAFAAYYDEGHSGRSETDAYVIDSIADIIELRDRINGADEEEGLYYKLAIDLNLENNTDWIPIGDRFNPFKGHFDGNNKTVRVKFLDFSHNMGRALFGFIQTEESYAVKNLNVRGSIKSPHSAAGIAVRLYSASIENCSFTGTLNSYGHEARWSDEDFNDGPSNSFVGGIVDYMFSGTIKNCVVKNAILKSEPFNATVEEGGLIGGIVARMAGGTIENCTVDENSAVSAISQTGGNNDSKSAEIKVGGIAGCLNKVAGYLNRGSIKNNSCYAQVESDTNGHTNIGGIVGEIIDSNISIEGNTYDGYISAQAPNEKSFIGGILGKMGVSSPTITGNKYNGADYGIGYDAGGNQSDNPGCAKIVNISITITTTSLSNGMVDVNYSEILNANVSDVTWSVSAGKFPLGLELNSSTGQISGKPTTADTYNFTIKASKGSTYTTREYSIKIVEPAAAIKITTDSLPNGTVNKDYSQTLKSDTSGVTWSVSEGTLPDGLKLNSSTGEISGTPENAKTYNFTIKATKGSSYATKEYSIKIETAATGNILITTTFLPGGTVNTNYYQILSSNTFGVMWLVTQGTLPDGLTLNRLTGVISGKPEIANTYTFTVMAFKGLSFKVQEYTVVITSGSSSDANVAKPAITTTKLKAGKVGKKYTPKVKASGKNVTWSASGLPSGVEINPSTGKFSGLPENSGTYNIRVTATNGGGSDTKTFSVVINDIKPNIKGKAKAGKVGDYYLAEFFTTKGTGNIVWTLTPENLPEGLEYDYDTEGATIEGTPEETWKQKYTLTATNSAGSKTKKFTLKIKK